MQFRIKTAFASMLALPVAAQTITTSGLTSMAVVDAKYDVHTGRLDAVVKCRSSSPLTAWAIEIDRVYADGYSAAGSVLSDYVVQLGDPDRTDSVQDEGLCGTDEQRLVQVSVSPDRNNIPLTEIEVRVVATASSERVADGDEGQIAYIAQVRSNLAAEQQEWRSDLASIGDAQNPGAALIALRNQKQAVLSKFGQSNDPADAVAAHARQELEVLEQIDIQSRNAGLDIGQIVRAMLDHLDREVTIYRDHSKLAKR